MTAKVVTEGGTMRELDISWTSAQVDRAMGVLAGMASGDAMGAGYEFQPPMNGDSLVPMVGGGPFGFAPGEWTDDTSMAIAIAELAAQGLDLAAESTQDALVARWCVWAESAQDVGMQTRAVLAAVAGDPTAQGAREAAQQLHERSGRSGGNGSLMRTAPVAVALLGHDYAHIAQVARAISALTHFDPEAGDACALWTVAIAHAVKTGELDIRIGLELLSEDQQEVWAQRLDEAETEFPYRFVNNGWVVEALMGAWSAIYHSLDFADEPQAARGTFAADHFSDAIKEAVCGGGDTDTVAAIAGGLVGAKWGRSAIPLAWYRVLHGWPGLRARDLVRLSYLALHGGQVEASRWPAVDVFDYTDWGDLGHISPVVQSPGLFVGAVDSVRELPIGVDAVVSLCRLGVGEVPAQGVEPENHVEVWLIDRVESEYNQHLDFTFHQAQQEVATLLDEGRQVLLHCVQGISRTPAVLALHLLRTTDLTSDQVWGIVSEVLPHSNVNAAFREAIERLHPVKGVSS